LFPPGDEPNGNTLKPNLVKLNDCRGIAITVSSLSASAPFIVSIEQALTVDYCARLLRYGNVLRLSSQMQREVLQAAQPQSDGECHQAGISNSLHTPNGSGYRIGLNGLLAANWNR
jgi:hypothetical protein